MGYVILIPLFCALLSCAGVPSMEMDSKIDQKISETEFQVVEKDPLIDRYAHFLKASLYASHGQYEKARLHLLETLQDDPNSPYLHKKMAVLSQKLRDTKGAVQYAKRAIELAPEDIGARILLAEIYALSSDEDAAMDGYQEILKLKPDQHRIRLTLVTMLIKKERYHEALDHLNTLIEQDPDLTIAYYYRGRIQLELKQYPEAEKDYIKALELNEAMQPAFFDLAGLYQLQERFEEAVDVYEKMLTYYPSNMSVKERLINLYYRLGDEEKVQEQAEAIQKESSPGDPVRQTLGLIYLKSGKLDEAVIELDLIVSAWPDDDKSRYYLSLALEEKNDLEKALEHLALIKPKSSFYINAQVHTAYILNEQEKDEEAIVVLQKVLAVDQNKIDIYLMLSSIYETKEAFVDAIKILEDGLKVEQDNLELLFRLGVIYDKSGNKDMSLKQMRRILELDPEHADALNYIGYTYAEQGIKLDEALDLIQRALALKPDSGYIIDSLGWVYYQQGLYDEALRSLEKAISIVPNDPTIAEHLGDAYFKKMHYRKSLEMYKKALSLNHIQQDKIKEKIEALERLLQ
ncbi:MAG: tetratricopeptide repeat protein [Deltaproteobacteria bacterium]|nr:tetratricopeptide repeat protein [Deltaproteobacteria bacterium]